MASKYRKDRRYKRLLKTVKDGLYDYPFDQSFTEIQELHNTLRIRKFTSKHLSRGMQDKLLKANTQLQVHRSRVAELLVQAQQFRHNLEDEYKRVRNHIHQEYGDELDYRTKEERSRALDAIFEPVIRQLNRFVAFHDNVQLILEDFDKSGWSIKHSTDILALHKEKGRQV